MVPSMTARTGRPPAASLLAVGLFAMAAILTSTGAVLTQLARCCVGPGDPPPAVYVLTGAVLSVGLCVLAMRLWRGVLSQRAALLSEILVPVVFVGVQIWALRYLGWRVSSPLLTTVVVVMLAGWVLAWRAVRRPSGQPWLRVDGPEVGP